MSVILIHFPLLYLLFILFEMLLIFAGKLMLCLFMILPLFCKIFILFLNSKKKVLIFRTFFYNWISQSFVDTATASEYVVVFFLAFLHVFCSFNVHHVRFAFRANYRRCRNVITSLCQWL